MRPRLATALLTLASAAFALALAEGALRLGDYRFSPLLLVPAQGPQDWRPHHMDARDARVSPTEPVTVFDSVLLWRLNPRATAEIGEDGYRAWRRGPKAAGEYRIVAVGDSNTLGPLHAPENWPAHLESLANENSPARPVAVINAGVYGYSSLQGLRRFRQALALSPDMALFSFGGNDGHVVGTTDADYAARAARLGPFQDVRLAAPLAHAVWALAERLRPRGPRTPRVPLPEYRRNLEVFVAEARARGVVPVLLTRPYVSSEKGAGGTGWTVYAPGYNDATREVARRAGAPLVDVEAHFRGSPADFVDESHFTARGHWRAAQLLLRHMRELGVTRTDFAHAPEVALGAIDDARPELVSGWWARETWDGSRRGRWTGPSARLRLERRGTSGFLELRFSAEHPQGATRGHVEVGRHRVPLSVANGAHTLRVPLPGAPERVVDVDIVIASAFAPASPSDPRTLGVFVHSARLDEIGPVLDLGREGGAAAVGAGWYERETWPDGTSGRWTADAAELSLAAPEGASSLVLELVLPEGGAEGRVETTAGPARSFSGPAGPYRCSLPMDAAPGRRIDVRILPARTFRPRDRDPASPDARRLGVFVRSARLAAAE